MRDYLRKYSAQPVLGTVQTGNQGFHLFELYSRPVENSIVVLYR